MGSESDTGAHDIVFGLNRTEDERSLASFLKLFSKEQLATVLIPRMSDAEIQQTVELLTGIMRNHLSEKEYHSLFLGDGQHSH